jgi:UDP-2-acetamido-3-amino-2,3-dideoxy-glucuronate N-acetyltransferase
MSEAAEDFPRLVSLPSFSNEHGLLYVAEGRRELGFTPRRFYFMTDVPRTSIRGIHAHKTLRQGMICLRGSVTVELEK